MLSELALVLAVASMAAMGKPSQLLCALADFAEADGYNDVPVCDVGPSTENYGDFNWSVFVCRGPNPKLMFASTFETPDVAFFLVEVVDETVEVEKVGGWANATFEKARTELLALTPSKVEAIAIRLSGFSRLEPGCD